MHDIERLTPDSTGRWLVHTSGTTHLFDLDQRIYMRSPSPASRGGAMEHDNRGTTLTNIEIWPEVGARFLVWFDDPDSPEILEHWRYSSTVNRIEPANQPDQRATP